MEKNNMKNLNLFILVIAVLAMVACGKKTDKAKVMEQQKELIAKWDNAMNAGDADALASLYSDDAIRMTPNIPMWVGNEAIRNGFRSFLEKNRVNGVNNAADVILTDDYVISRGTYTSDFTPKTGGNPVHDKGKWISVSKLQSDGSLKIIIDIWNSDLPPVASNQ